jgi:putative methyltransferase (TIGR04325 family)
MPVHRTHSYLRQFIPPLLLNLLKKRSKYGWKGDFENWQQAKNHSGDYDDSRILEKVKEATGKVKKGEAAYERDSVLFEKIQYSWPLLSALFWIALQKKSVLKVADFGGSLGSSYYQNQQFLSELSYLEWNIIEQENFVRCGREFFQDNTLRFFYSIDELIDQRGMPDVLILSCVLPYLDKPYDVLKKMMDYQIPYILIDNTYFNYEVRDRICVQEVPPEIYTASYPCWMLNYSDVKSELTSRYQLISEHENDSCISLDGIEIRYRGMFLKRGE